MDLPEGAKVTAQSEFCKYAALAYNDRAYTVQAHPEFSGALVGDLVDARRGQPGMPDDIMTEAVQKSSQPLDDKAIAAQIAAFFKQPRKTADV